MILEELCLPRKVLWTKRVLIGTPSLTLSSERLIKANGLGRISTIQKEPFWNPYSSERTAGSYAVIGVIGRSEKIEI